MSVLPAKLSSLMFGCSKRNLAIKVRKWVPIHTRGLIEAP